MTENFQKRKKKGKNNAPTEYLSLNRTGSPLKVDNKAFGSEGRGCALEDSPDPCFPVVCTFLFTAQERQLDTAFCNQPGPAGFLTHPAQKANPLQSTYFRFTSRLSELQPGN